MKTYFSILFIMITSIIWSQNTHTPTQESNTLTWQGKAALGSYTPEGTLKIKDIEIQATDSKLQALTIVVDMTSLYQENVQLSGHLRGKDFFHVKKHKTAVFKLLKSVDITSIDCILTGAMTIKGKTNTELIEVRITKTETHITIDFNHTMDRTQYDINYNSPSIFKSLKENVIADNFTLKGTLVFTEE
ncbi:YceI family protein [Dokdonia sp.]|uniref:YceI family protein n=1 Tax=Dokdonia sp. TaxID=2024995 RepID=UPI0032653332